MLVIPSSPRGDGLAADHFFVVTASQRNAFADPSMELICSAAQGIVVSPCPGVPNVGPSQQGVPWKNGRRNLEVSIKHVILYDFI